MALISPPQWNTPFLNGSMPSKPWQKWLSQIFNFVNRTSIITSGPAANRPTNLKVEDAGQLYFSNDTGVTQSWNGTAWLP